MQDRWIHIQVNRVAREIFAQGLLSKRQTQIAWAVILDSWVHYHRGADPIKFNWTRDPMPVSRISLLTGMHHQHVSAELRDMVGRGIICLCSMLSDHQVRLHFNEHFNAWAAPKRCGGPDQNQGEHPHRNGAGPAPKRCGTKTVNQNGAAPKRCRIRTETVRGHLITEDKYKKELLLPQHNASDVKTKGRKKRTPTAAEKAFLDGFKNRYGHEPEIKKPQAIELAKRVSKHGTELVIDKINTWWDSPAGNWADANGARGVGAFLHSFDQIIVNGSGPEASGVAGTAADRARFERYDKYVQR